MQAQMQSYENMVAEWSKGVPAHMLTQDGIKAQFAAAYALIEFLRGRGGAWGFFPCQIGGIEDRIGIDGYLFDPKGDQAYAVDFSLESDKNPRGNKRDCRWLVHLKREWFDVLPNGLWKFRKECMRALALSFLPALENGASPWTPLEATIRRGR
jgi:hypothetical protein